MFETNNFINICTDIENNYEKYFESRPKGSLKPATKWP